MLNPLRRPAVAGLFANPLAAALLALLTLPATQLFAQDAPAPPTRFEQVLSRFDLGLVAQGTLTTKVSGIEQRDQDTTHTLLNIRASSTVGELATLRYIAHPWLGFEFNFSNARFTQNYTFTPPLAQSTPFYNAQVGFREMTLGYVARPKRTFFTVQPFFGAGGGTIRFNPTPFGGEGLPFQYRAAFYYNAGLEDNFPDSHFGMRIGFRQLIYLAPDFQQNYLTITRRVRTSEPIVGFFVNF